MLNFYENEYFVYAQVEIYQRETTEAIILGHVRKRRGGLVCSMDFDGVFWYITTLKATAEIEHKFICL